MTVLKTLDENNRLAVAYFRQSLVKHENVSACVGHDLSAAQPLFDPHLLIDDYARAHTGK